MRRAALRPLLGLFLLVLPQVVRCQPATITTVAGTGSNIPYLLDGIVATSAQIPYPSDIDIDGQDNLYFVYGDNVGTTGTPNVYRISPGGQLFRAYQLPAYFNLTFADGVAVNPAGDTVYVTNYHAATGYVVKMNSKGQTNIGTPFNFSFGTAPLAGLRVHNNQVYVVDSGNSRIVRIGTDGTSTIIAGTGTFGYGGDGGDAKSATFNYPTALAVDASGTIFIADTDNNCIRKISSSGTVSTFAGTCTRPGFSGDLGPAISALLSGPTGVAVASDGTFYISDTGNNLIRRVNVNGSIETIAGGGYCDPGGFQCVLGDGGAAVRATLNSPMGLALDSQGRLYIADKGNHRIRQLTFTATSPAAPLISTNNGIVNGASFVPPVSQGAWATIYGQNFSTKPARIWTTSDFVGNTLPITLDGASVTFNDKSAAIYYVSATQLNVQVPDGLPDGEVTVKVTTPAGTAVSGVQHQAIAPGLFTIAQVTGTSGSVYYYPAAVHLDGTLVGRPQYLAGSRPVVSGELIMIYGTGFGPSNPPQPSGVIIPVTLLDSLPIFTLAGNRALVDGSALVSPGLYQFNITVPSNLQSNTDYAIQIGFLAGGQSQTGVYLPVK